MLKMLKMVKKYINIYKYKLSLFGRDDTKQATSLTFIVVPQAEQFQKVQSTKKRKGVRTYNNSNYKIMNLLNLQVVPDKVFLCLKVCYYTFL